LIVSYDSLAKIPRVEAKITRYKVKGSTRRGREFFAQLD
jgi:hypothetical protein